MKSDIGAAMVVTLARTLIVIISYSLASQTKSILKKMEHAKLIGLQVKRFMFLKYELPRPCSKNLPQKMFWLILQTVTNSYI